MRPSQALSQHRDAVCLAAARYRVVNPRVFGSAVRGEDQEGSDLDLLVDTLPGTHYWTWEACKTNCRICWAYRLMCSR
jgi:predicted nucleotidyltransferase